MTATGFSVRRDINHKPPKGHSIYKTFHKDWEWVEGDARRLRKAVTGGTAVTPGQWGSGSNRYGDTVEGYKSKFRGEFIKTDFVLLDFDNGISLEDAIKHPYFCETASFLYTSPSHRLPHKGDRLRVVWQLTESIKSWREFDDLILGLRLKLGEIDDTSINAASMLFGTNPNLNNDFTCHIWGNHANRLDPAPLVAETQRRRAEKLERLKEQGYEAGENWEYDKETCDEDRVALMIHCLKYHDSIGGRFVPERIPNTGSYDIVRDCIAGMVHYFGAEITLEIINEAEWWGDPSEGFDPQSLVEDYALREELWEPGMERWCTYNTVTKFASEHLTSVDPGGRRGVSWVSPVMPSKDFCMFKYDQQEEPPITAEELAQAFADLEEPSMDDMLSFYNPIVAEQIKGKCENILANPEMAAMAFLSAAASVIGRKMHLNVIHGYRQEAILWTMNVSKTSTAKDAAARAGAGFLYELQRIADENHERDYRGKNPSEIPRRKYFTATDGQIQGTIANLERDGSLFRFQDECIGFFEGFDQYNSGGKGNEEQKWLKLWTGADISELLKSEKDSYHVKQPRVSIAGLTQLDPLLDLMRRVTKNGETGGNGMFGRWLINLPTMPKKRYLDPHSFYYGNETSSKWDATSLHIGKQLYLSQEETLWRPSFETAEWYRKWLNKLFEKTEKESGFVRDYIQKERAQIGRTALVFAGIDLALTEDLIHSEGFRERELPLETLQRACGLFEYHVNQIRVLVSLMKQGKSADGADLAAKLEAKIEGSYAANDIIEWRRLSGVAPLQTALRKKETTRQQVEDLLRSFDCVKEEDGKFIRV
ncbi:YfjI family protein [bacterium]|nr:YfjI family protein [bacterium]